MGQLAIESGERLEFIYELIGKISSVGARLAKLKLQKEELEKELINAIGHDCEGQKTYEVLDKNITIRTNLNYRVDAEKYEELRSLIPDAFDPVCEKRSYFVNKKLVQDIHSNGPFDLTLLIDEFVEIREGKPSVKILPRT